MSFTSLEDRVSAVSARQDMPPMLWDTDVPRTRLTDPVTSHEAADQTADTVAASQAAVLGVLRDFGPLADFEVAYRLAGRFSESRMRTARNELAANGLVEFTGGYHMKHTGRRTTRCQVWQAVTS